MRRHALGSTAQFRRKQIGSLEPGKLANLVVIDRDYLTYSEDEIRHIKVLRAVVVEKSVFQR